MKIPSNLAKSSLLATGIFWVIGMTDGFESVMLPLMFISYVPVFVCCTGTILLTICPFYFFGETKHFSKRHVFQRFYPYYSIVCFALCAYGIYENTNETFLIGFFVAVFFTTMQSWIWFAKEPADETV